MSLAWPFECSDKTSDFFCFIICCLSLETRKVGLLESIHIIHKAAQAIPPPHFPPFNAGEGQKEDHVVAMGGAGKSISGKGGTKKRKFRVDPRNKVRKPITPSAVAVGALVSCGTC